MMKQKITAIFNGEAFYPIEAFNLEPNTKVTLTIETQLTDKKKLKMMARDPDIIKAINMINEEFLSTEMDGLREHEN